MYCSEVGPSANCILHLNYHYASDVACCSLRQVSHHLLCNVKWLNTSTVLGEHELEHKPLRPKMFDQFLSLTHIVLQLIQNEF